MVVVIDWFGKGGGMPNIRGGCEGPGTGGGGATYIIPNNQNPYHFSKDG